MPHKEPYNPLAKANLGESVADALLRTPVYPLSDTGNLVGAGVYVIYYTGNFAAYAPITARNADNRFDQPIYVGKTVPKGARKGGLGFEAGRGTALRDRLRQHAGSLNETTNLDLVDFHYRALVVDDIWIPLGENVLIEKFQPLWNRVVDGFGIKTPGKGRAAQRRSSWDTLHPGRKFVDDLALGPSKLPLAEIINKIADSFAGRLSETEKLPLNEENDDEA